MLFNWAYLYSVQLAPGINCRLHAQSSNNQFGYHPEITSKMFRNLALFSPILPVSINGTACVATHKNSFSCYGTRLSIFTQTFFTPPSWGYVLPMVLSSSSSHKNFVVNCIKTLTVTAVLTLFSNYMARCRYQPITHRK